MNVGRVEIDPSGRIILFEVANAAEAVTELDRWMEKQHARPA